LKFVSYESTSTKWTVETSMLFRSMDLWHTNSRSSHWRM